MCFIMRIYVSETYGIVLLRYEPMFYIPNASYDDLLKWFSYLVGKKFSLIVFQENEFSLVVLVKANNLIEFSKERSIFT
jgi:hypothetical protein